jgi:hypothetical protein
MPDNESSFGTPGSGRWTLTLFGVAAILAVSLPFLWRTVANPYIDASQFVPNISHTIDSLQVLNNRYGAAIAAQHSFKTVSSVAALIVGAAAIAAGVLRAPQLVIVAFGVLSALVYGVQALFYNQTAISSMETGRSELACIAMASNAFGQNDNQIKAAIPKLQSQFASALPALENQRARLAVFVGRLKDVSAFRTEERRLHPQLRLHLRRKR